MIPVASTAGGLFSQLAPLLAYRAVLITVSKLEEGDLLQVNICPRQLQQGENQTLTAPLCVTGTAAELDVELVSQLATFFSSHVGLTTNLAVIEQEVAEAEKAAREAAKKKHKAVGNGGGKSSESASSTAAVSSKPQPEPPKMLSLFDQQMQKTQSEASEAIP